MKKKTLLSAWLKPGISVLIPLLIVLMPASWLHIPGITPVEQRVLALFLLAALFWILEPIPIFATSVLIIVLELIMISDAGLGLLRYDSAGAKLSNLLDYRDIMATFASPVILLFLGGFFSGYVCRQVSFRPKFSGGFVAAFRPKTYAIVVGHHGHYGSILHVYEQHSHHRHDAGRTGAGVAAV